MAELKLRRARSRAPRSLLGRWCRRAILGLLTLAVVGTGLVGLAFYGRLKSALPKLDGVIAVAGLDAPVDIARDGDGLPLITAASRPDASFALGFLHAQERFFQMDLGRRIAAGELAELFGDPLVGFDRTLRRHRLRETARRALAALPVRQRRMLDAYAAGVAAALDSAGAAPFEYLLLRTEPRPWRPVDTLLCILSMYVMLQDTDASREMNLLRLHRALPEALAGFIAAPGSHKWDAPLRGSATPDPAPPKSGWPSLTNAPGDPMALPTPGGAITPGRNGSNAWALGGAWTADGAALVAADLHLPFGLPNMFYQATLAYRDGRGGDRRVTGLTLPGVPLFIIGGNGHVAWGVSNSAGDWSDLVVLDGYAPGGRWVRTAAGRAEVLTIHEEIKVRGGPAVAFEFQTTPWGPVLDQTVDGDYLAQIWVAHFPEAVNLALIDLETTADVGAAMAVARRAGLPAQNFVVGDTQGHVGWTLAGPIPRRAGAYRRLPRHASDPAAGWSGWVRPDGFPRLTDPAGGRVWSANGRMIDGPELELLGIGSYILGARAQRIRDVLAGARGATEADMQRLQMDDRSVFLDRWRDLLVAVAERAPKDLAAHVPLIKGWSGHATVDDRAHGIIRDFRAAVARLVFAPVVAEVTARYPEFELAALGDHLETPLWQLVSSRTPAALEPRWADWDALLAAAAREAVANRAPDEFPAWGSRNRLVMGHPMSPFIPLLGLLTDMAGAPLNGDIRTVLAQTPTHGPVVRMVVSPGHPERALFAMAGGQSANPLSPYYSHGQRRWLAGEGRSMLPQPARYRLRLEPATPPRQGGP